MLNKKHYISNINKESKRMWKVPDNMLFAFPKKNFSKSCFDVSENSVFIEVREGHLSRIHHLFNIEEVSIDFFATLKAT